MKFSMTWQEIGDLLNTGDYLIEVTIWAGLTVLGVYIGHRFLSIYLCMYYMVYVLNVYI